MTVLIVDADALRWLAAVCVCVVVLLGVCVVLMVLATPRDRDG